MSTALIVSYTLFSFFFFYQQLHIKNFQGASQGFRSLLGVFAFFAMINGFVFLIYYGYKVSWLNALSLLGIALAVKFIWFGIEARLGLRYVVPIISMAGFIVIPFCAYFMWSGVQ